MTSKHIEYADKVFVCITECFSDYQLIILSVGMIHKLAKTVSNVLH